MKLYAKLLLGFGSIWTVFLMATMVGMYALQHNGAELEVAFHSNFDSVVYCERMKNDFDEIHRQTLGVVWMGQPPSSANVEKVWEDFRVGRQGQAGNITLPGEKELTATLFQLADDYQAAATRFMRTPAGVHADLYREDLLGRYLAARNAAQAVIDLNMHHLLMVEARLRENLASVRQVQFVFVGAAAALALAFVFILTKTVLGPLRIITQSAQRIETGDLDLSVNVRSRDELGELANAFNAMTEKLREYRRLDHARLLRTQKTTQLAIDSLPDAVAVFNPQGEVEISNQQARIHFGLMPGSKHSDAHLEWLTHLVDTPLSTGIPIDPLSYQSAIQLFDAGQERPFCFPARPMFDDHRHTLGVVVILVDVTRLHHADELKSGLVATISHELKTPLAATRFSVHLLAQESVSPLDEQQRKLVAAACQGADRLHRIIENLLQFQRIEEGRFSLRLSPMSPLQIVAQVVDQLRPEFVSRNLVVNTLVAHNIPQVLADPDLIGYVLSNLLSNSLKFVPPGGQVDVAAVFEEDGVHFSVADNGPGIPAEHLPKLFQRFFRAAASKETPGAGLGLSIARQLVEAHGGRIIAEPLNPGIRFTFILRVADGSLGPVTTE